MAVFFLSQYSYCKEKRSSDIYIWSPCLWYVKRFYVIVYYPTQLTVEAEVTLYLSLCKVGNTYYLVCPFYCTLYSSLCSSSLLCILFLVQIVQVVYGNDMFCFGRVWLESSYLVYRMPNVYFREKISAVSSPPTIRRNVTYLVAECTEIFFRKQ